MPKTELHLGDCLQVMPKLADKSIDLILCDPPYNIGKAKWDKIDNYIDWCGKWILECQRVLKDNGSFYFFHNDMQQIAQLMEWIRGNSRFVFKSFLVIDKLDNTYIKDVYGSQNHFRNYLNLAEYCLFYTFQDETGLKQVYDSKDCFLGIKKYLKDEKKKSGLTNKDFNLLFSKSTNKVGCTNRSVIEHYFGNCQWVFPTKKIYENILQTTGYFKRPYESLRQEYERLRQEYESLRQEYENLRYTFNGKDGTKNVMTYRFRKDKRLNHPTQKPVDLIENIIRHSSNEGDTVLDPFMGSGTTGVAAKNLNRNFIGIEILSEYFSIAKNRIDSTIPPML
jgi:site-specific DNA-methyltransferase (adenine-specific)